MLMGKLLFLKADAQRYTLFLKTWVGIHKRGKFVNPKLMFSTIGYFFIALRRDLSDFSLTSFQGNWYRVHRPDQRE